MSEQQLDTLRQKTNAAIVTNVDDKKRDYYNQVLEYIKKRPDMRPVQGPVVAGPGAGEQGPEPRPRPEVIEEIKAKPKRARKAKPKTNSDAAFMKNIVNQYEQIEEEEKKNAGSVLVSPNDPG